MAAGDSAAREALTAQLRIDQYVQLIEQERGRKGRYAVASRAERSVAAHLEPMSVWGWTLLPDRRWPGTRNANVDMLHVGPGGVLVIDVKAWAEPHMAGNRLFNGDADQTEDADKVLRVAALAEGMLADLGLAPLEVHPVLVFAGRRGMHATLGRVRVLGEHDIVPWAMRLGWRLTEDQVKLVTDVVAAGFPAYETPEPATATVAEARPVVPRQLPPAEPEALFDVAELERAVLDAAAAEPIESWMTFLHPDQARFVRRSWSGPSRVRGAAGTGKTVVGLHRAAYLAASRPGRILVTTYVRTLPVVLSSLFARLAPHATDRVEFCGLHRWAKRFLEDRSVPHNLFPDRAETLFSLAWSHQRRRSPLARLDLPFSYWREEIDAVIKGRGLTRYDEYAALSRTGRKTPLQPEHRAAVWDLYQDYDGLLRADGVDDYNDLLVKAYAELRRVPLEPGYGSVIVDEVQDLPCIGMRLLHALVGDRADGLMLIGDGQQAIYPGGFTLTEAGISVTGRSTVLRVNYRNGAAILDVAAAVVRRDEFDDLEDHPEPGDRDVVIDRAGGQTMVVRAADVASHDVALLTQLREAVDGGHAGLGDLAILAPTNELANRYVRVLRDAGIAVVPLADYTGVTTPAVKVGTYQRAKGLEFAYVFLPQLRAEPREQRDDETKRTYVEQMQLERRRLYVAMTRARDGLWLGYVGP